MQEEEYICKICSSQIDVDCEIMHRHCLEEWAENTGNDVDCCDPEELYELVINKQ